MVCFEGTTVIQHFYNLAKCEVLEHARAVPALTSNSITCMFGDYQNRALAVVLLLVCLFMKALITDEAQTASKRKETSDFRGQAGGIGLQLSTFHANADSRHPFARLLDGQQKWTDLKQT